MVNRRYINRLRSAKFINDYKVIAIHLCSRYHKSDPSKDCKVVKDSKDCSECVRNGRRYNVINADISCLCISFPYYLLSTKALQFSVLS